MRVLVTGVTTPVGTALAHAFLDEPGVDLVLGTALDSVGPQLGDRFHYEAADLSRARNIRSLLFGPARALGIDAIVHSALHRSAAHRHPHARALDVDATRELLRLGEELPALRRFVYRSFAEVYHVGVDSVEVIDEEHRLELGPRAPRWVRDRVEADLAVCAHAGLSRISIAVLRCAEIFAPGAGSQLWDYVQSRICLRPLGYDPMVEVLSPRDAVRALVLATRSDAAGVFNIPGADVLPLSQVTTRCGRRDVPVPGPLLSPLYRLRAAAIGGEFRYDMNRERFHFGAVLDGRHALRVLGYAPRWSVEWPSPAAAARTACATGADLA
jgi:UDP-glucose 4-epimerase